MYAGSAGLEPTREQNFAGRAPTFIMKLALSMAAVTGTEQWQVIPPTQPPTISSQLPINSSSDRLETGHTSLEYDNSS